MRCCNGSEYDYHATEMSIKKKIATRFRATAEELYSLLISRADEILDFSIRVYEGSTSTFALHPRHDVDRKCRQVYHYAWVLVFSHH